MKYLIFFLFLFINVSILFGQDCKFRTTGISISFLPKEKIKVIKKLCIYEFDTAYDIRFKKNRYKIINNVYSDKIILINVKRLKDFKSVNQTIYFRLDTNNLTFDKVINFADSVKYDTAENKYWLYLKNIPQITFINNDENSFFDNEIDFGEIEIKNESKLFSMIVQHEVIPYKENQNYLMGWVSLYIIKLKK